jgi:hypothetical protein
MRGELVEKQRQPQKQEVDASVVDRGRGVRSTGERLEKCLEDGRRRWADEHSGDEEAML